MLNVARMMLSEDTMTTTPSHTGSMHPPQPHIQKKKKNMIALGVQHWHLLVSKKGMMLSEDTMTTTPSHTACTHHSHTSRRRRT
jgi:hypothetical protein